MSDKYFVDTNILMYAHDTSAGAKHERAKALVEELWRDRTGVVSTQVLQELSVNLRRKVERPLDVKATREIVADYLTWQVVVNSGESILDALDLEARYQFVLGRPRGSSGTRFRCGRAVLRRSFGRGEIRVGARDESASDEPVKNHYVPECFLRAPRRPDPHRQPGLLGRNHQYSVSRVDPSFP